jgi:putative ABC transport system ATP-binding protein
LKKEAYMIQLRSVYRSFKMGSESLNVLNNINLIIKDGEFIAIMGPSGSGKSTLANVIGGLDRPTAGQVQVDDQELDRLNDTDLSEYRNKKVGFVFQAFNLLPGFTALENVMLPLMISGMSPGERKKKAHDYLKVVGLEHRAHHKPSQLSGGERQRVSIARAIVNEPKIIIADEPTGNLDSKKTMEIMQLLKFLNTEQKITLIVITHDAMVAREADISMHMVDGKLTRAR